MTGLEVSRSAKPIIAAIPLAALPGSGGQGQSLAEVTDRAVAEAKVLAESGYDALLIQNTGDLPSPEKGDESTVAFMTHVAEAVMEVSHLPLGISVLVNGSRAALAIAAASSASFVRIKVLVGAVVSSAGIVEGAPHDVLGFRQRIGAQGISILADVYDRTAAPVGNMPIEVMADLALRHGGASGLILTGYNIQETMERLRTVRSALPNAPLLVGGGANINNVAELLALSDGIIVASAYKTGGRFLDPVDPEKAVAFMEAARRAREELAARK